MSWMVVNSMGMPTLHDGPREASLLIVVDGKMDGESGLYLLDEHHGVGADALFSAGEAQSLGGGGLDGDIVLVDAHDMGETCLHRGYMRIDFGPLGADGGVDIAHTVAAAGDKVDGFGKQYLAVYVECLCRGVRE